MTRFCEHHQRYVDRVAIECTVCGIVPLLACGTCTHFTRRQLPAPDYFAQTAAIYSRLKPQRQPKPCGGCRDAATATPQSSVTHETPDR